MDNIREMQLLSKVDEINRDLKNIDKDIKSIDKNMKTITGYMKFFYIVSIIYISLTLLYAFFLLTMRF